MDYSSEEYDTGIKPDSEPNHSPLAEENFEKMIAEVEDYAIFLLDVNGTILSWNKGAEKIKGYKASEIIGKSYQLFYLHEDLERNLPQQLLDEARTKGKVVYEGWRVKKDGTRFWGNITITAIHYNYLNITGYLKLNKHLT
jgi:PAS domain S-box-containing protein